MHYIDLHTHSTASDGTDSPTELVTKAHTAGLAAVAVSDHDTLQGLDEAQEAGAALGIEVIRGCELSTQTVHGEIHILGLWIPPHAPELEAKFAYLHRKRRERNTAMLAKLRTLGITLDIDEVQAAAKGTVGRPHIAAVMVQKGYVADLRQAFTQYLGVNGKAYLPKEILTPDVAVKTLREVGATVAVAHPLLQNYPRAWMADFVRQLATYGMDAIEVWHSEHTAADVRQCVEWAKTLGLGMTGGSDYHGTNKPHIHLGVGKGTLRIPYDVLTTLKERRRAQGLPC